MDLDGMDQGLISLSDLDLGVEVLIGDVLITEVLIDIVKY